MPGALHTYNCLVSVQKKKVGDERIRLTVDQRRWRSIVASEESYGYLVWPICGQKFLDLTIDYL